MTSSACLASVDEQPMGPIIAAGAVAALGFATLQAVPTLAAAHPVYKTVGEGLGLCILLASILLLIVGVWRHFEARKATRLTKSDVAFYVAMAAVITVIICALVWFAGLFVLRARAQSLG